MTLSLLLDDSQATFITHVFLSGGGEESVFHFPNITLKSIYDCELLCMLVFQAILDGILTEIL